MTEYDSDDSFDGILAGPIVTEPRSNETAVVFASERLSESCDYHATANTGQDTVPSFGSDDGWGDGKGVWEKEPLVKQTNKRDPGDHVGASNALTAAEMKYGDYIIVIPNSHWIPQYPLLDELGIVKRDDGFWGGHEYAIWPQFYSQNFAHHACMPQINHLDSNRASTDDRAIHFYDPVQDTDFEEYRDESEPDSGVLLGSFTKSIIAQLDKAFWIWAGKTSKVGGDRGKLGLDGDSKRVYQRCIRMYQSSLQCMESLRMTWREALSTWRDAQRALIEIRGLHTFLEKVVPRIDSGVDYADHEPLAVRGAFTTSSATVHHLYRIGIPVWFICRSPQFKGKVFDTCEVTPWKNFLSPKVLKVNGRSVLDGLDLRLDGHIREDSVNHFMGENHIRGLLDEIYEFQKFDLGVTRKRARSPTPSPASIAETVHDTQPGDTSNTASGSKRSQSTRFNSNRRPRVTKPQPEPNVNHARILHIPASIGGKLDLPPYHPSVLQCLKNLTPIPDDRSHPALYPLPPPFLLIHSDVDKTAELYLNYIRIRPTLIDIVIEGSYFDKSVWRKMRDWRVILHGDYVKTTPLPPNTTSPFVKKIYDRIPQPSSPRAHQHKYKPEETPLAKKRRVADVATIKVVLHAERRLEPFDKSKEQVWRQRRVTTEVLKTDKAMRMEVQWELSELLFRCEVFALDGAVVPRQSIVRAATKTESESGLPQHLSQRSTSGARTVLDGDGK